MGVQAKTIENYLGEGYTVLASYGHVRDLVAKVRLSHGRPRSLPSNPSQVSHPTFSRRTGIVRGGKAGSFGSSVISSVAVSHLGSAHLDDTASERQQSPRVASDTWG